MTKISKEQFQDMYRDLLEDARDPHGDLNGLIEDFTSAEEISAIRDYDPGLYCRFEDVAYAIRHLRDYVLEKAR